MSVTEITLQGKYPTGTTGTVTAVASTHLVDTSTSMIYPSVTYTGTIDTSGNVSIIVPATDDSTTEPENVTYRITEKVNGAPVNIYDISVPHAAPGGIIQLASVDA